MSPIEKRRWLVGFIRESFMNPDVQDYLNNSFKCKKPIDSDNWIWEAIISCMKTGHIKIEKPIKMDYDLIEKLNFDRLNTMSESTQLEYISEQYAQFKELNLPIIAKTIQRSHYAIKSKGGPVGYKKFLLSQHDKITPLSYIWGIDKHNATSIIKCSEKTAEYIDNDFLFEITEYLLPEKITKDEECKAYYTILASIAGMNNDYVTKIITLYKTDIKAFLETNS